MWRTDAQTTRTKTPTVGLAAPMMLGIAVLTGDVCSQASAQEREPAPSVRQPPPDPAPRGASDQEFGALGLFVAASPTGVLVVDVQDGSPADKVGLRSGSFILSLNGEKTSAPEELLGALEQLRPGDTVQLNVWTGGETRDMALRLASSREFVDGLPRAAVAPLEPAAVEVPVVLTGLSLREADEGVTVVDVEPRSPADQIGLRTGDTILSVGGVRVSSTDELYGIVDRLEPGAKAQIEVQRGDRKGDLVLTIPVARVTARPAAAVVVELPVDTPEYARILLRQQQENTELIEALLREVQTLRAEVDELRR